VEGQCYGLRHGKERSVLRRIARLRRRRGTAGKSWSGSGTIFATHAGRINYQQIAARGWPIGSGAVESACAGIQKRFKRLGQFWRSRCLRRLNALIEAHELNRWDELWLQN